MHPYQSKLFTRIVSAFLLVLFAVPRQPISAYGLEKTVGPLLSSSIISEAIVWSEASSIENPSPRTYSTMVYDANADQSILFGGQNTSGDRFGDTWAWDGGQWNQLRPQNSPSARTGHAMVYDSIRKRVILVAGFDGSWPADTWEWNGTNWEKKNTLTTPPGPTGHALAYDSTRQRVVMFGGFIGGYMDETWEYDGTDWVKRSPLHSPPGRAHATLAYDANRGRVVLFGGYQGATKFNDVWEWDGIDWIQKTSGTSPQGRSHQTLVYDPAKKEVILFGGENANGVQLNDLWEWNGTEWKERIADVSPLGRSRHAAAFDIPRQKLVVFGGQGNTNPLLGDTWLLTSLRLESSPGAQAIAPGASAQFTLTAIGSTSLTHLTISGLPDGMTMMLTPGADINSSEPATLMLNTLAGLQEAVYPITITGQSNGLITAIQISLEVIQPGFSLSVTPSQKSVYSGAATTFQVQTTHTNSFTDYVTLTLEGLPQGTQYTFTPNPVPPGASSQLEITTAYTTVAGDYPISINGNGGGLSHSQQATLTILPVEISVNLSPTTRSIYQNQSAAYTITVNTTPSLTQPIALSVAGLESVGYTLADSSVMPGGSTTLTVNTTVQTQAKSYNFSVTGSLLSYTKTVQGQLQVLPASFTVSVSPQSRTVKWGETTTFLVTTTASPGFTSPITLSGQSLDDLNASFSVNPVIPGASSTLTIRASSESKTGIRIIAVQGSAGSLQNSGSAQLEIKAVLFLPMIRNQQLPGSIILNAVNVPEGGTYTLSWTEQPKQLATGYIVQESSTLDFTAYSQVCDTVQQTCLLQNKLAGVYYYRVRGYNDAGAGPWSNVQQAKVLLPETPVIQAINNSDGNGDYRVSWSTAARSTSYTLEESLNANFSTSQAIYTGSQTSWNVTSRPAGTFYYRVRATGPTGTSAWSTIQSVQVPEGVSILSNYTTYRSSGYQIVVGEIQNHSPWYIRFVKVVVNFFNGSQLVDTDFTYTYLENVHPGEKACFQIVLSNTPTWDSYSFEAPTYSKDGTSRPNLTITTQTGSVSNGFYNIIGVVRNDSPFLVTFVSPVATLYDANGKVVDCDFTYVNSTDLNPQQTSSFSLVASPPNPSAVTTYTLQVDGD